MDEKNNAIKIKLSTLLLVLSIIIIIVMAFFIYNLNNDKKIANNEVVKLNTQISELETTIDNLQDKISNIPDTITKSNNTNEAKNYSSSETTTSNDSQEKINDNKVFSNDEIQDAIQNYLDLVGAREGSPEGLLVKLGLTKFGENTERADNNYIKTNIKYSDYENKMLNYMTKQWFENNFTNFFKDVNGYLYFFDGGATGLEYKVKSITLKGDYSDLNYIASVDNIHIDDSIENLNIEFHIENNNGKCVISYCD